MARVMLALPELIPSSSFASFLSAGLAAGGSVFAGDPGVADPAFVRAAGFVTHGAGGGSLWLAASRVASLTHLAVSILAEYGGPCGVAVAQAGLCHGPAGGAPRSRGGLGSGHHRAALRPPLAAMVVAAMVVAVMVIAACRNSFSARARAAAFAVSYASAYVGLIRPLSYKLFVALFPRALSWSILDIGSFSCVVGVTVRPRRPRTPSRRRRLCW